MPGIGWTEILIVLAIAIIVVGPKDLPILMRTVGRFMGKARALAREFQENFEEIAREAEFEELKKDNEKLRAMAMMPVTPMTPGPSPAAPMAQAAAAAAATPMTAAEEAKLHDTTNAQVMAAEASVETAAASEAAPLEPGGPVKPEDSNVTPFRGGARR